MPKEIFGRGYAFLPRAELLSFEEITRLARVFAEHGVTKVRLTGGEPLLRRDLERLVEMLAGIPGLTDVALTTNGTALAAKAQVLKSAGLSRVTVTLPLGTPLAVWLEQVERFAKEVMPAFNVGQKPEMAAG